MHVSSAYAGLRDRMEADVSKTDDCREKVRFALESFRDWCFENPTVAVAVLSKFFLSVYLHCSEVFFKWIVEMRRLYYLVMEVFVVSEP